MNLKSNPKSLIALKNYCLCHRPYLIDLLRKLMHLDYDYRYSAGKVDGCVWREMNSRLKVYALIIYIGPNYVIECVRVRVGENGEHGWDKLRCVVCHAPPS